MARYLGPTYKKSRRFGFSILENGKELSKKPYAPGDHGQDRKINLCMDLVKSKWKKLS